MIRTFAFLLMAVLLAAMAAADTDDPWVGKRITVVNFQTKLKDGNKVIGKLMIGESYTVVKANGSSLFLNTRGGGWVNKKNVVLHDEAIDFLTREIQTDPSPDNYYRRGVTWRARGELDKAMADFTAAIQKDSDYGYAFSGRGSIWHFKGRYDKAISDFNEAIRRDPADAISFVRRGMAWAQKRDYETAIADYNEAIRLDQKFALAFNNRGFAWNKLQENEKAIEDYTEAIRLDPTYATAYRNRANRWNDEQEYDKAERDFNEAVRLDPDDTHNNNQLAWFYATCPEEKHRNGNQALKLATKACEASGWKVWYYIGTLAAANAEAGDFEKAVEFATMSMKLAPESAIAGCKERLALYEAKQPYHETLDEE